MFARNLLQAGEFVTTVPVGIPVTLQYGDKGSIQKVYLHHEEDHWEDITDRCLQSILRNKQAPNKIGVKGGTSWVRAVMYTANIYSTPGSLPDCVIGDLLKAYDSDPSSFKIYAGDVQSLATTFRGAVPIRQWLNVNGFETLPGWVVPADINEQRFEAMVTRNYPFQYPLISSYILFHKDGSISYPKTDLRQFVAKKVVRVVDEEGNICADIHSNEGDTFNVPYPYVVKYNINVNTLIVHNSDGEFIFSAMTDSVNREKRSRKITCSCCGRQLNVPDINVKHFRCSDSQCNSVLYPRVSQMLSVLGLPVLSYAQYSKLTKSIGNIFSLPDVFDNEVYADTSVEVTLGTALRAFIPKQVLPGDAQISQLCDACSNSLETLTYYIQHVDKMKSDLSLDHHAFNRFYTWLLSDQNAMDLTELLRVPNIKYVANNKKFDGAPIFRDKMIMLTGTFSHGSYSEVSSILGSYSAKTTTTFSPDINLVLVGNIAENVRGKAVLDAKRNMIPVMQESQFFSEYGIDEDMAENL